MFAVIETGGKQYKVNEGDIIFVEKLDVEAGSKVEFDRRKSVCRWREGYGKCGQERKSKENLRYDL